MSYPGPFGKLEPLAVATSHPLASEVSMTRSALADVAPSTRAELSAGASAVSDGGLDEDANFVLFVVAIVCDALLRA
jgi:hypothetical protein